MDQPRKRKSLEEPGTDAWDKGAEGKDVGLLAALVSDGLPLLNLLAVGLIVSGIFALFLSATHTFLPHDIAYLGMQPSQLCQLHDCRLVHFMFHDRVSFGGVLIAIGTLYLWMIAFPLAAGQAWAWQTLLITGAFGFLTFFSYRIYGYFDLWHAVATLGLLPLYVAGIICSRRVVMGPNRIHMPQVKVAPLTFRTKQGFGRVCLLLTGAGMTLAGLTIMILGSTVVFVPQDLAYFQFTPAELAAINPRLIPLIAHDRAGFGGGIANCGLIVLFVVWNARLTRALWQALLVAGVAGFGCAIGIHFPMGYTTFSHLLPAYLGAVLFATGIVCYRPSTRIVHPPG